ncbi:zf-CCHC domain-containing protein, partial [Tanacetum coccineum]
MVESMLSYSGLSQGFWGEAILTTCYLLNRIPNKRNMITLYELWTKRKANLNYLTVWGCRAVAEHSKAFRFYVIEPNESVLINSIIESRDVIFDENRFSSVPRPSLRIPNGTKDIGGSMVPEKVTEEEQGTGGNSQVKDNKIDLLVQQYEQFVISEDKSIDSAFARFNTIITSLKALDEGYSSKNYVRKFLRDLHPKWRANVTAIKESKDLTSLSLDELIENLKNLVMKSVRLVKAKVERKSVALKAKKESSDEKCSTSDSKDEEYALANGKSDRKCFRCGDPNHLIGECPKPPKDKNQRAFVEGSWSDSGEEDDEKVKDEMCLVAHASSE